MNEIKSPGAVPNEPTEMDMVHEAESPIASPYVRNIRNWIVHNGLSYAQMAREIGVSKQTISSWASKGPNFVPSAAILSKIANHFDIPVSQLLAGPEIDMENPDYIEAVSKREGEDDYIKLPDFPILIGAGAEPQSEIKQTQRLICFPYAPIREVGCTGFSCVCVRVHGNSMAPTLNSGDRIIIDRDQRKPEDGCVYAFTVDEVLKVKRFADNGDEFRIISDNTEYAETTIRKDEPSFSVIGRVILKLGKV